MEDVTQPEVLHEAVLLHGVELEQLVFSDEDAELSWAAVGWQPHSSGPQQGAGGARLADAAGGAVDGDSDGGVRGRGPIQRRRSSPPAAPAR